VWTYTLQPERRTPPCPQCQNVTGVVRLKPDVWVCMDCHPRRAFEATWSDDDVAALSLSEADLTPEERVKLDRRLLGVGKRHQIGYAAGWIGCLVSRGEDSAFVREAP
jgi:hypothetical protein